MNQLKWIVVSTAFFLISIPSVSVYGQNEPKQDDTSIINLDNLACRDLVRLGDSDQEATIAYFHGFINGKNNDLTADVVQLGDASEKVIDHCIENPSDSLLTVFEQYRTQ